MNLGYYRSFGDSGGIPVCVSPDGTTCDPLQSDPACIGQAPRLVVGTGGYTILSCSASAAGGGLLGLSQPVFIAGAAGIGAALVALAAVFSRRRRR